MNREQVIERLKQIKTNLPNYPMDAIADITFLLERLTDFCEFITNPEDCNSIYVEALKRGNKDLVEQNARLQAQLDREIKINRKMKSALEQYAYEGNWDCLFDDKVYGKDPNTNWNADGNGYDLAQQILKEIDNKE